MQIDKVVSFIKSQKNGFFLIEIKTDYQSEIIENSLKEIFFQKHIKIKNSVIFFKHRDMPDEGRANSMFYADRYDYLRIAKTMMEDLHNDTCAGKYLKTIYENRIKKKDNVKHATDVGLYTKSYGGQIHFDIFGIKKERKIIGLSGFAGQNILIDLDNKRIIVVNSLYRNYNWKKIVYKKIKNNS